MTSAQAKEQRKPIEAFIGLRVDDRTHARIIAIAESMGVSVSEFIRMSLENMARTLDKKRYESEQ